MASASIKFLHDVIAEVSGAAGFRKKGSSWYAQGPDAIAVINPQKSQYGIQYFLNLGIYWRELGEKASPREEECHIRSRIEDVAPKELSLELKRSLDFEDLSIDDGHRAEVLRSALGEHAIPFLQRCSSEEGVRAEYQSGRLKRVTRDLMAHLDLWSIDE